MLNPSSSEDIKHLQRNVSVSFLPMDEFKEDGHFNALSSKPLSEIGPGYSFFQDGDVAFAKVTPCFENGKGAVLRNLINGVGFGSTELIVARPRKAKITSNFLYYLFFSSEFRHLGKGSMYGTGGLKRVPDDFVKNYQLHLPPVSEQTEIAEFLDRQTNKIDQIVQKQERLIELLVEKRQAVISHAVTKGLDPTVPMKDSGIEWIGFVPKHWPLGRFKNTVSLITSGSRGWAEHYSDEGALFLRIANVTRYGIDLNLSNCQYVTPPFGNEAERSKVQNGDILISITADLGSVAVIENLDCHAHVSQHVSLSRPKRSVSPRWLAYAIRSSASQAQLLLSGYGGAKIQLSLADVADVELSIPNYKEQVAIAKFLDCEIERLNILESKAERSIELMKERRSALISAAVTGKIDVREVA
jgi:type I restriction enzyme S subunit